MRLLDRDFDRPTLSLHASEKGHRINGSMVSRQDVLDYLADLLAELKGMAAKAECRTLANLLELTHDEAVEQARVARQSKA